MDFNVDYKILEKLNLSLVVNNLFNQNFYVTQNITDLEVSIFKYKLVPRFALLKIEFRVLTFGLKRLNKIPFKGISKSPLNLPILKFLHPKFKIKAAFPLLNSAKNLVSNFIVLV